MHVLVIPNVYPTSENDYAGIFFKRQVEALSKIPDIKIGVISPNVKSIRQFKLKIPSIKKYNAHYPLYLVDNLYNIVPFFQQYNEHIYRWWLKKLYDKYVIENGKPDIIHAHVGIWAGYAAVSELSCYNIPIILTEHSSALMSNFKRYHKEKIKLAYNRFSHIIAVSNRLKKSILGITNTSNITVIPNMISVSNFFLGENNKYNLITVGNLTDVKGYDILLNSFKLCLKEIPTLNLTIVGKGIMYNSLYKLSQKLGVESNVNFTGMQNINQINELFKKSGIFVSSSRVETFGIAIIEAMASGLPVVATKSGGPEEIIIEGTNGYLCEPENMEDLKNTILKMINTYSIFNPVAIREHIINSYSDEVITHKINCLYKDVLNNVDKR